MTSLSQGLAIAGGGGGGGGGGAPTPPGGVTTEIQFNDAGAFAGTAALTFEKVQKVLILNKLAALTPAALQQIIADWGPSLIAAGVYDTTNPASFPDYSSAIFASPVVTNAGTGLLTSEMEFILGFIKADGTFVEGFSLLVNTFDLDHPRAASNSSGITLKNVLTGAEVLSHDGLSVLTLNGSALILPLNIGGSTTNHAILHGRSLWPNGIVGTPTSVVFTDVAGATAGALVRSNLQQIGCADLGPVLVTVRGTGNPKVRISEQGVGDGPPSQHAVLKNGDIVFLEATAPAVVAYVGSGFSGTWTVAT